MFKCSIKKLCIFFTIVATIYVLFKLFFSFPGISVTFDVNAERDFNAQVFWTDNNSLAFREKFSIKQPVKAGKHSVKIELPTNKVTNIRLDLGVKPGNVSLSNLQIHGHKTKQLNFNDFTQKNLNAKQVDNEFMEIFSDNIDPYLIYKSNFLIRPLNIDIIFYPLLGISLLLLLYSVYKKYPKLLNLDLLFVIIFFTMLIIPILKIDSAKTSKTENRTLAVFPEKVNQKFGKNFEAWFNDRFFGREFMLKVNDNLKKINTKLQNDKAFLAKDNWMFYKPDDSIINYTNKKNLPDANLKKILTYLSDIDNWCKQHNKQFYFVIPPDKNKIYPEYFPDYIGKARPDEYGIGNTVAEYIRKNSDINVIYLYDTLMEEKSTGNRLLYYKNDTHWNQWGAYIAYKTIYKEITNKNFNPASYIKSWKTEIKVGDLANMLKVGKVKKFQDTEQYPVPEFYKNIEIKSQFAYDNKEGITESINPNGKKNVFILRDSFSSFLSRFFAQSFHKVKMHWTRQITKEMLNEIDKEYDIVVLEVLERSVPYIVFRDFPKD